MSPLIEVAHLFRERTETKALNTAITSTRSGGQAQPGLGSLQHPRTGESSHSGAWEGGLATAKRRCGERKFVLLRSSGIGSKSLDGHRTRKTAAVAINDSSCLCVVSCPSSFRADSTSIYPQVISTQAVRFKKGSSSIHRLLLSPQRKVCREIPWHCQDPFRALWYTSLLYNRTLRPAQHGLARCVREQKL